MMGKSTAVYIRVSTENRRADSQQKELRHYCQQRLWTKTTYYVDKISGAKGSRPELDRLIRDMRAGKIERLVVYRLDRLGRSLTHLALILEEMEGLRVPLIASSQTRSGSHVTPRSPLYSRPVKAENFRDAIFGIRPSSSPWKSDGLLQATSFAQSPCFTQSRV